MPELPDIVVYQRALQRHIVGRPLLGVRLKSPFLLRSVDPPLEAAVGRLVCGIERLGKRLVLAFDDELFWVLHLMIAGRLRWRKPGAKPPGKIGAACFDFEHGTLLLTEASTKKRASLYVVAGREGLAAYDRGGLEVLSADLDAFDTAVRRERHTTKRALTDPRILSGIGNAYSDEILHRAELSPFKRTDQLTGDEMQRLFAACRTVLTEWTERLLEEVGDGFPEEVTAFRANMAVHGKYGQPCPRCGASVQRIRYADNEANYCASCQTGGRLLADRSLSRLLKADWPKTLDELEALRRPR